MLQNIDGLIKFSRVINSFNFDKPTLNMIVERWTCEKLFCKRFDNDLFTCSFAYDNARRTSRSLHSSRGWTMLSVTRDNIENIKKQSTPLITSTRNDDV